MRCDPALYGCYDKKEGRYFKVSPKTEKDNECSRVPKWVWSLLSTSPNVTLVHFEFEWTRVPISVDKSFNREARCRVNIPSVSDTGSSKAQQNQAWSTFCYSERVKDRIVSTRKAWWIQTIQPSPRVAMEIWLHQILFRLYNNKQRVLACRHEASKTVRHEKEMMDFHRRHSVSLKLTISLKASWLTVWRHLNKTRIRVHLLKCNMYLEWLKCPSHFKSITKTSNESLSAPELTEESIFAGQSDITSWKIHTAMLLS